MNKTIYILFILLACASTGQEKVEIINAQQLIDLRADGIQVIDIRTANEYNQGHLVGVVHVDFFGDDFLTNMNKLDKDRPIIIHCASGGRSARAAQQLLDEGFIKIYDYSGGFSDWSSKGLEIEQR